MMINPIFGTEVHRHLRDAPFQYCSGLTSVTIPSSITSIGYATFYNCSGLTSVTILNSVKSIGNYAFYSCSGLMSVTIPNSVRSIGSSAFLDCTGLTSITVDVANSAYSSIDGILFNEAQTSLIAFPIGKIGAYTIPNSVTSIGDGAFSRRTGLTNITVDVANSAYSSIDGILFNKAQTSLIAFPIGKIGAYTIPNSVTSIRNFAFLDCTGLTSVTIPNSVTSIGNFAFYDCSGLTSVTIPNRVTSISPYAFYSCTGLTSVTIGNSVTSIDNEAFSGCSGLTSVYFMGNAPTTGWSVFNNAPATIYYITGKTGWTTTFTRKPTATFIPTPPSITSPTTATATVGQLFTYTIQANKAPTRFAATGLPVGLSINAATGVISGTPTTVGINTITLSASDDVSTGTQSLTLTVNLAPIISLKYEHARSEFVLKVQDGATVAHTIEYSTDLKLWTPLATQAVGSTDLTQIDPQATTSTHRFYRVIKR